jgi:hypothetical protein
MGADSDFSDLEDGLLADLKPQDDPFLKMMKESDKQNTKETACGDSADEGGPGSADQGSADQGSAGKTSSVESPPLLAKSPPVFTKSRDSGFSSRAVAAKSSGFSSSVSAISADSPDLSMSMSSKSSASKSSKRSGSKSRKFSGTSGNSFSAISGTSSGATGSAFSGTSFFEKVDDVGGPPRDRDGNVVRRRRENRYELSMNWDLLQTYLAN